MATLIEALAIAQRHLEAGRLMAAEQICQQILHQQRGNQGALQILRQISHQRQAQQAAIAQLQQRLQQEPQNPLLHNQLGVILRQQKQFAEAIACYQQAIALKPDYAEVYNNLGNVLRDQQRLTEAIAQFQQAIAFNSRFPEAHTNLALALREQLQLEAAIVHCRQAILLQPDFAEAHFSLSLILLTQGDFLEGFREYEWRWKRPNRSPRPFSQPKWQGEDLTGKTILIHAEQGLGDTLQFIRFLPQVQERGGRVLMECQPALVRLLGQLPGIAQIIPRDAALPEFDVHAPLLSLPHILGTTLDTLPAKVPYLHPVSEFTLPPAPAGTRLKVGLVWAGNPNNPNDRDRSLPLPELLPLLRLPEIAWYSLQKGDRATDLNTLPDDLPIIDLNDHLQDFADTAAAIAQLDQVITVDTAVAHLAGALGKPVWVLLCYAPDWRWMGDRSDSPWYPTARLFRQPAPGDWASVFQAIAPLLSPPLPAPPVSPSLSPLIAQAKQHFRAQRYPQVEALCQQILRADPQQVEALAILGLLYCQVQQYDRAIAPYQQVIALQPDAADAHHNLGLAHAELGQFEPAIAAYRRSLELEPDNPKTLYNLGNAYRLTGQLEEAIAAYQEALRLEPNYADALHNLGVTRQLQGQIPEAKACYERAIALKPDYPEALNSLGTALRLENRWTEAVAHLQRAIALRPSYAEAYSNLGLVLCDQADFQGALNAYQQALQLRPDDADAHFNLSLLLLLVGNLSLGFQEYEWRWKRPDVRSRCFDAPRWQGEDLTGKTILVWAEQGLGDTIQFLRYLPLLTLRGAWIWLECLEPLVPLLRTAPGIDQLVVKGDPLPEVDYQVPLMSLPYLLGTTLKDVPAAVPYLHPEREFGIGDVGVIGGESEEGGEGREGGEGGASLPRFKIGIVWAGNPLHHNDRNRSSRLQDWLPLFEAFPPETSAIAFYSLQKGEKAAELQAGDFPMISLESQLNHFADTAAAIAQLDLILTVDTSVAHLAGAMAKPVWVLLSRVADWRWLWQRTDSPWYPSARLFRQATAGDWQGVMAEVVEALADWFQAQPGSGDRPIDNNPNALRWEANIPDILSLANQQFKTGRLPEAAQLCQQVLLHHPNHFKTLNFLGLLAETADQQTTAMLYYQRAIATQPDQAKPYNALGNTLQRLRRYTDAIPLYERAIALQPDYAEAYNNLGAALEEVKRYDDAVTAYQQSLALKPNYAAAHYNLGNVFRRMGQLEDAIAAYQQAIALRPNDPLSHNNLGLTYADRADPTAAIAAYDRAIALKPDYADAYMNRGIASLMKGQLREGFRDYEWRWQVVADGFQPLPDYPQPLWDGADLTGKTILLKAEQGLGDTLQFVRYVPLVAARGGRVLMEVQRPLVSLLANLPNVAQAIAQGEPLPAFDTYCPLLSLPERLGTTLETIPAEVPYVSVPSPQTPLPAGERGFDPVPPISMGDQMPSPQTPLPEGERGFDSVPPFLRGVRGDQTLLKVGIVWAGSPTHRADHQRSCPLAAFLPLFQVPGVQFYSLQVGEKAAELVPYQEQYGIVDLSDRLTHFADTAADIQQLDLVITVDTAVAHLTGALGKPVWVLLCYAPDWRWMLDRPDSPWYPTARLFRQPQPGDWASVLQAIAQALPTLTPASSPPPQPSPPPPPSSIGIGWSPGIDTGWRIYGLNLALELLKRPAFKPVPLLPLASPHLLNPIQRELLQPLMGDQQALHQLLSQHPDQVVTGDLLMLRPLGNHFVTPGEVQRIRGKRNVGVIFFEDTQFTSPELEYGRSLDRIITGSTWNTEILRGYGLENVVTVQQGIDPTLFHPAPRSGLLGDRFVIFSGGKLEYRKGQDIVIAAFKAFQARHPEALLLTAWQNPWVETLAGLERSPHLSGLPTVDPQGRLQIKPWLVKQGIPADAVMDVGLIPNYQAAQLLREADVALFPNRAEGGTNLVAMECLACGIPTLLSANTGHLDLLQADHGYPLRDQQAIAHPSKGTDGWGESNVEEILEILETLYRDRPSSDHNAIAATRFAQGWNWSIQIDRLLEAIAPFLSFG